MAFFKKCLKSSKKRRFLVILKKCPKSSKKRRFVAFFKRCYKSSKKRRFLLIFGKCLKSSKKTILAFFENSLTVFGLKHRGPKKFVEGLLPFLYMRKSTRFLTVIGPTRGPVYRLEAIESSFTDKCTNLFEWCACAVVPG